MKTQTEVNAFAVSSAIMAIDQLHTGEYVDAIASYRNNVYDTMREYGFSAIEAIIVYDNKIAQLQAEKRAARFSKGISFIEGVKKGGDNWKIYAHTAPITDESLREIVAVALSNGYASSEFVDYCNTRKAIKTGGVVASVTNQTYKDL